jgi:uncharacterized membrane protein YdjX (TVP38/TMEM64 family)
MKDRNNIYLVALLLIIVFADWFTWHVDNKLQQVWGAHWMGSARWIHPVLFFMAYVCIVGLLLGVWRAIFFKRWRRSK